MHRDTRAQSIGIVRFFASLGGGAAVVWAVQRVVGDSLDFAEQEAQLSIVQQSNAWFRVLVENLPVLFLLIASMGGIAWAIYQTNYA